MENHHEILKQKKAIKNNKKIKQIIFEIYFFII